MIKYEFDLEFELPVSYPLTPFEIVLPQLDGKTSKMYRGGKICLSAHFKPLWAKNVPQFGIAHALAMGVRIHARHTDHNSLPSAHPPFARASCLLALFSLCCALLLCSFVPALLFVQLGPWLAAEVPHLLDTGMLKDHVNKK